MITNLPFRRRHLLNVGLHLPLVYWFTNAAPGADKHLSGAIGPSSEGGIRKLRLFALGLAFPEKARCLFTYMPVGRKFAIALLAYPARAVVVKAVDLAHLST
jgi:hypothetical protein